LTTTAGTSNLAKEGVVVSNAVPDKCFSHCRYE
jgi:hypothetical protein